MLLHIPLKQLIIIMLALLGDYQPPRQDQLKAKPRSSLIVQACLPRVSFKMTIPIFWNVFGQSGDNDGEETNRKPYDKEAEDKAKWTTNDWIEKHKYALELHNVTTADGYELQLQRMPQEGKRPILLVHGLLTSSLGWVLQGPAKSLAFLLYDKQYDVWLANLRGSIYARNHTHFNTSTADFWSFSFHEMGYYDLPAIVDYVREQSSFHQVILIGHSEAFNAFLVMCSKHPIYNERILFMQALAPIAELHHQSKLSHEEVKTIMKHIKQRSKSNAYELFPTNYLKENCLYGSSDQRTECTKYMNMITGTAQYARSLEPIIYGQLLRGGSLKQITHLQQLWRSGDFIAYDYGVEGNRQYYNAVIPDGYNLTLVSVPVILHFGLSDALATAEGVHRIYSRLLPMANILGVYRVAAEKFNHLDFFCGNDVKTLLNDKIIDLMEKYFAGKLQYVIE